MDLLGDWTQLRKKIYELEDMSIETKTKKVKRNKTENS